jgi:hypothetical protein
LDSKFEVGEERVGHLVKMSVFQSLKGMSWTYTVSSEGDMAVLEKLVTEEVCKGVVFLVEGEDGGVGSA